MIDFLDSDLRAIMEGSPLARRDARRRVGTEAEEPVSGFFNAPLREDSRPVLGESPRVLPDLHDISFTFASADAPANGEVMSIGGELYEVYRALHDGHGMVTAFLREKEAP